MRRPRAEPWMDVLYIGSTWRGSNAQSWRRAFELSGHRVTPIDTDAHFGRHRSLAARLANRIRGAPPRSLRSRLQRDIIDAARATRPQIVFAVKGVWIDASTLRELHREGACLIHWHPDDYRNRANSTAVFLEALPHYDVVVTPKSYNVDEYRTDGAHRVEYLPYAYDPEVHHPIAPSRAAAVDASFVGGWEPERADSLEYLAASGIKMAVWGAYWHRLPRRSPLRRYCHFREVFAEDMARVFAQSAVSLGFLRKANRDLHTARTFEIPACGGVMLAERTDEQRGFFDEGREALYFGSNKELLATVRRYSPLPHERDVIRESALRRCRDSRYSYRERLEDLLSRLNLEACGGSR